MHFGFDDLQLSVRDTVGSLLEKRCDTAALEQAWRAGSSAPLLPLWNDLASIGVPGLIVPEAAGGAGFDGLTMALVLAECGRKAVALPVLETAAVAVPLLWTAGDPGGVVGALVDGSALATLVTGRARYATASSVASYFLADDAEGAVLYARDEVTIEPVQSVDRTRDLAVVTARGAGIPLGPTVAVGAVEELAALAASAVLIGLGEALVATTVDYVKERKQFGVPIGSFQAVKHQLADAHLGVQFAAPAVWAASDVCYPGGAESPHRARMISMAKALASDAASVASRVALQCHGAMGYTDDYPLHMWLKRVWCLTEAFGSAATHRSRVAAELGI